jgi:hypothetical protein
MRLGRETISVKQNGSPTLTHRHQHILANKLPLGVVTIDTQRQSERQEQVDFQPQKIVPSLE